MPRTSPRRATLYLVLFVLLVYTAFSWHASMVAAALLAITAAFAVELIAPTDD